MPCGSNPPKTSSSATASTSHDCSPPQPLKLAPLSSNSIDYRETPLKTGAIADLERSSSPQCSAPLINTSNSNRFFRRKRHQTEWCTHCKIRGADAHWSSANTNSALHCYHSKFGSSRRCCRETPKVGSGRPPHFPLRQSTQQKRGQLRKNI